MTSRVAPLHVPCTPCWAVIFSVVWAHDRRQQKKKKREKENGKQAVHQ